MKINKNVLILLICLTLGITGGLFIQNMPGDPPLLARITPMICLLFVTILTLKSRYKNKR